MVRAHGAGVSRSGGAVVGHSDSCYCGGSFNSTC